MTVQKIYSKGVFFEYDTNLFTDRHIMCLNSEIIPYFDKSKMQTVVTPILEQKSDISLRLLDWLVTNHAKQKFIQFKHSVTGESVVIFYMYKKYLRSYKRKV